MKPLKIGLVGVGHLGKIHLKCLQLLPERFEITGFYDTNSQTSKEVEVSTGISAFDSIESLIDASEAIDIVTPTVAHYDCAIKAILKGKHVFIEKPISHTIKEAKHLAELVSASNIKLQVGHVERFNPAFLSAEKFLDSPGFIEAHRLSEFNPRGTDVSVVLDLMIHDLDIVLHIVKSKISNIHASGVSVVSDTPDICNARIEFENGCVANLTASRISMKNMRKTRFFQKDAYVAVDFLNKNSEIIKLKDVNGNPDPHSVTLDLGEGKGIKEVSFERPASAVDSNPIKDELMAFSDSIRENAPVKVDIYNGLNALEVAYKILEKIS